MIALAADRWREEQRNAELAAEYVQRLAKDIRIDLGDYAETAAWARLADDEVLYVLNVYRGREIEHDEYDRLVGGVMRASWGQRPRHAPETRNDLISTGNISLLPINVRSAMSAYYGDVDLYNDRWTLSLGSCFEPYWVAIGRIIGPDMIPDVWRGLRRSPDYKIEQGALNVGRDDALAVLERLRAESGLEGVLAKVRHCHAQRIEINEERLPRAANKLLQELEKFE